MGWEGMGKDGKEWERMGWMGRDGMKLGGRNGFGFDGMG